MDDALSIAARAIIAPAAIALAIHLALRRVLPTKAAGYPAAVAWAASYAAAFALLRPWKEFLPDRHWHWTGYLAVMAAAVGPLFAGRQSRWLPRLIVVLLASAPAAWLLVPTWATLQPPRPVWMAILATYFFVLASGLGPLEGIVPSRRLMGLMALSAAATALLVALGVSLTTFGQPAAAAAAGWCGCLLAIWGDGGGDGGETRGVALIYTLLVGGWAFVGCVHPTVAKVGLLVAAAAPLVLWCFAKGPLARLSGQSALVVQTIAVLIVLAAAVALVVLR